MLPDVTMLAKIVDNMNACSLFVLCIFFEYILKLLRRVWRCLFGAIPLTHGQHVSHLEVTSSSDRRASEEPRSRRVNDIMIMMKKKVDVDALWTKNNSNLLLESIQSFREG